MGGATIEEAWAGTLEAMRCLLCMGLPINIWKCQFLVQELNLLGMLLAEQHFQLGRKAMRKLFASHLPRTLLELQSLLGRLNFAANFIPTTGG